MEHSVWKHPDFDAPLHQPFEERLDGELYDGDIAFARYEHANSDPAAHGAKERHANAPVRHEVGVRDVDSLSRGGDAHEILVVNAPATPRAGEHADRSPRGSRQRSNVRGRPRSRELAPRAVKEGAKLLGC